MELNQQLIDLLSSDIKPTDALLAILGTFDEPCSVSDVQSRAFDHGYRRALRLNVSGTLVRSPRYAVRTGRGWAITTLGREYLLRRGLKTGVAAYRGPAESLRYALNNISHEQTRHFVEEAVGCHESGYHRSAVIMSWVGAVSMLQDHVVGHHLAQFNEVAQRKTRNWEAAKTSDDLGQIRESEFLDRLSDISVIGKDVKKELKVCLGRRNSCGHPNSLQVGEQESAYHLEMLINNVFSRVCSLCGERGSSD